MSTGGRQVVKIGQKMVNIVFEWRGIRNTKSKILDFQNLHDKIGIFWTFNFDPWDKTSYSTSFESSE